MCARVAISCGFLLIFNFAVNDDFACYFYAVFGGTDMEVITVFALSLIFLLPFAVKICAACRP